MVLFYFIFIATKIAREAVDFDVLYLNIALNIFGLNLFIFAVEDYFHAFLHIIENRN